MSENKPVFRLSASDVKPHPLADPETFAPVDRLQRVKDVAAAAWAWLTVRPKPDPEPHYNYDPPRRGGTVGKGTRSGPATMARLRARWDADRAALEPTCGDCGSIASRPASGHGPRCHLRVAQGMPWKPPADAEAMAALDEAV